MKVGHRISSISGQAVGGVVFSSGALWYFSDSKGGTHGPFRSSHEPIAAMLASESAGLIRFAQREVRAASTSIPLSPIP